MVCAREMLDVLLEVPTYGPPEATAGQTCTVAAVASRIRTFTSNCISRVDACELTYIILAHNKHDDNTTWPMRQPRSPPSRLGAGFVNYDTKRQRGLATAFLPFQGSTADTT